jgi:sodium-dependent dicarboxylate transporter 2/3/5
MHVIDKPMLAPTVNTSKKWTSRLLGWETASGLPWDVILLLGGGFALAAAFQTSGLAVSIGNFLTTFKDLPIWVVVLLVSLIIHGLSEFTSNTATTQVSILYRKI